jgi:hypothetical protein
VSSVSGFHFGSRRGDWQTGQLSSRLRSRLAAAFYFLAVGTAVFAEFFAPGRPGIKAILIPIACSMASTILLFSVFRSFSQGIAWLATLLNLTGLALEMIQWQPRGVNLAMVLHGIYAILLGWLMARSNLLPRILGALMALAGVVWLLYLVPSLAHRLAPMNTTVGLLSEAVPMFWFIVVGVRAGAGSRPARALEVQS